MSVGGIVENKNLSHESLLGLKKRGWKTADAALRAVHQDDFGVYPPSLTVG
jgi:hypothetical protein